MRRAKHKRTRPVDQSARPIRKRARLEHLRTGHEIRNSHSRASKQCGTHAMRRKIVPKAPRRMLADFPGGKWIDSCATNENRSGYSRKCKHLLYAKTFQRREM